MKHLSIPCQEVKLIILTHGDPDHAGSAKEIKEITGAKIAVHEYDKQYLEEGKNNWPPSVTTWGRITHFLLYPLFMKMITLPPVKADITLRQEEFPLDQYGIKGKIIFTPGHTSGSVSYCSIQAKHSWVALPIMASHLPFVRYYRFLLKI